MKRTIGISDEQFQELYRFYGSRLDVFLRNAGIRSVEDREDLIQEIMLKVQRNIPRYRTENAFSTWIYTIARNTAWDFLRRKQPQTLELQDDVIPVDITEPEHRLLREEQRLLVHGYLNKLSAENRMLAFLRFFENRSVRSCASIMGLPAGTVKYRLWEIRNGLRKEVAQYESAQMVPKIL